MAGTPLAVATALCRREGEGGWSLAVPRGSSVRPLDACGSPAIRVSCYSVSNNTIAVLKRIGALRTYVKGTRGAASFDCPFAKAKILKPQHSYNISETALADTSRAETNIRLLTKHPPAVRQKWGLLDSEQPVQQ